MQYISIINEVMIQVKQTLYIEHFSYIYNKIRQNK